MTHHHKSTPDYEAAALLHRGIFGCLLAIGGGAVALMVWAAITIGGKL